MSNFIEKTATERFFFFFLIQSFHPARVHCERAPSYIQIRSSPRADNCYVLCPIIFSCEQDIQQLLQLQQLVLVPGHPLPSPAQFLLPQAQQGQQGGTSPLRAFNPLTINTWTVSVNKLCLLVVIVVVFLGLLSTPNLIPLPQQNQGSLLSAPGRMGLQTQVRGNFHHSLSGKTETSFCPFISVFRCILAFISALSWRSETRAWR